MRRIFGILVAGALLAPAGAGAQEHDMRRPMGPGMHLEHLLEQRDHLELTAEQVARLEAIHREVEQKNRPLMEKLHAIHADAAKGAHARSGMTAEQREKMKAQREKMKEMTAEEREKHREAMKAQREKRSELTEEQREQRQEAMAAARPIMEEMRANHRAAMEAVREVLTDAQEAKLKALHESHPQMKHDGRRPVRSGVRS